MRAGLPALGGRSPPVAKRYGCSGGSQPTLATDPRSAVLAEHGRPSRLRTTAVFHASRTPTRTLAHTLLTIERTCPAGASWSLPLGRLMHLDASHPSTRAGFSNASPFAISNSSQGWHTPWGQLPPARRARGGTSGCSAEPLQHQFFTHATHRERREGWKAKPGLKVTDNFGGSTDRSCGSTDKKA